MNVEVVAVFVLGVLSLGAGLALIRLLMGPNMPDRLVALDLMTTFGVGICAVYAVAVGRSVYLDVAIVIALVAFLGTVTFARYVGKWAHHDS